MPQKHNIEMLRRVAKRLGPLSGKFVFIGGAVTGLFITDPAAADIRSTMDIDLITVLTGRAEYYGLGENLRELGFVEDTSEGAPLCRWIVEGIKVDVMPTDASILGFANRWYSETIKAARPFRIDADTEILLSTAPYFLATKLEAFNGRGGGDFLASCDMEDVISIIDGRAELLEEVKAYPKELQEYLCRTFRGYLENAKFLECIPGHLPPDAAGQGRRLLILNRLRGISAINQK